jgi:hypothetical protein
MKQIEQNYTELKNTQSDINEHLPTLYKYAQECETIAEFGVRNVVSSYSFALANPKKLICVDTVDNENITNFLNLCKQENINAEFHCADTLTFELQEDVDLLFIDTLHSFKQLSAELERHNTKVKKYIILHDTISFGNKNEDDQKCGDNCGLVPAFRNFLNQNNNWQEEFTFSNNNGLTILKRVK